MKKLRAFLLALTTILALAAPAQEINNRVGTMINESRWLELDETLRENPEGLIPMLDLMGRTFAAVGMNRPSEAVEYGIRLLQNHADELGVGNVLGVAAQLAEEYGNMGEWQKGRAFLESVLGQLEQYLDSTSISRTKSRIHTLETCGQHAPLNKIDLPDTPLSLPFDFDAMDFVGINWKALNMLNSCVNGHPIRCIFDSGACDNLINTRVADSLGLRMTDICDPCISPCGKLNARLAVADEVRIGGLTIRNVTFRVAEMSVENDSLSRIIGNLEMVIGLPVMKSLGHFTIDFDRSEITVGGPSPVPSDVRPNAELRGSLYVRSTLCDTLTAMLLCDTGDATRGTLVTSLAKPSDETILLNISGKTIQIPLPDFRPAVDNASPTGSLSLSMLRPFRRITFDLNKMALWPHKGEAPSIMLRTKQPQSAKVDMNLPKYDPDKEKFKTLNLADGVRQAVKR